MRILLPIKNSFLLLPSSSSYMHAADDYIDDDYFIFPFFLQKQTRYGPIPLRSALPLLTSEKTTAYCSLLRVANAIKIPSSPSILDAIFDVILDANCSVVFFFWGEEDTRLHRRHQVHLLLRHRHRGPAPMAGISSILRAAERHIVSGCCIAIDTSQVTFIDIRKAHRVRLLHRDRFLSDLLPLLHSTAAANANAAVENP
jgi:hypothetical protein